MAPGMTPAKRFVIRTALISGSTVALVVGAQTLIAVDVQSGRMAKDGSTISASNSIQSASNTASSGVTILRQSNDSVFPSSGDDDDAQSNEELLNQQTQINQQNQLFNSQQTFRRPRTHSSH